MSFNTIGLYANQWGKEFAIPPRPSRNPLYLLRWALWFKANPRSEEYMRQLFIDRYPDGSFIDVTTHDRLMLVAQISNAEQIVLLYPDAIGLGFARIEKLVHKERPPMSGVRVLNGRRREFVFSRNARRALRIRRFLEQTMLPELVAGLTILVATPLVLAIDLLKGKR